TVAPPPEVEPAGAGALWANLAGTLTPGRWRRLRYGRPHVVWQYTWTGRQLSITVWVPGTVPVGAVAAALRGPWPPAHRTPTPARSPPPPGGPPPPVHGPPLPLPPAPDPAPRGPLPAAGTGLHRGEYAVVQVLARPARPCRARHARHAAARLRGTNTAPGWW